MFRVFSLSAVAGFLLLGAAPCFSESRVVGYAPNWIDLHAFADALDYARLTHINIAFENPTDTSGELSFNPQDAALISKAHAAGVKVLVSIGGGAASSDKTMRSRYATLLQASRRSDFIAKLAAYVAARDFDGLDVDLEGPSITSDYGPFIEELAAALQAKGKLLTAALSKGYGGANVPDDALKRFDFVNIMAYDATGPWNPNAPGQHSSMDFAKSNVEHWLQRGLPKEKAVLGVPFYGYGFGKAYRKRDYPYAEIVSAFPGAQEADEVGNTVWYNGIATIRAKTRYVRKNGLGGVMIWSLDTDAKGAESLLAAIADELRR